MYLIAHQTVEQEQQRTYKNMRKWAFTNYRNWMIYRSVFCPFNRVGQKIQKIFRTRGFLWKILKSHKKFADFISPFYWKNLGNLSKFQKNLKHSINSCKL